MSAKFTPGPWTATCRHASYVSGPWPEDEFLQWEVEGPSVPWGRGDFHQADAYLVAAAPDLYEALSDLVGLAYMAMRGANRDGGEFNADDELADARGALAKARGEA